MNVLAVGAQFGIVDKILLNAFMIFLDGLYVYVYKTSSSILNCATGNLYTKIDKKIVSNGYPFFVHKNKIIMSENQFIGTRPKKEKKKFKEKEQ